jgi:hypothetical protein
VASDWIPLYFAQFAASQASALATLQEPFTLITAGQGAASQSVLNDPTAAEAFVSDISDFCSPLGVTTVLLGKDPSGTFTRATNPGTVGTGYVMQRNASYRDADQDGYENQLDTCPKITNISGDPRLTGSTGPNANGIDGACDVSASASVDVDGDVFKNRQDNCPQSSNATQSEAELHVSQPDNGPQTDGIGNTCDTGTAGAVGTGTDHCTGVAVVDRVIQNGLCISISLSTTVGNGRYHVQENVVAKCFGGTDADGDGYCTTTDASDSGGCAPHCAIVHDGWLPGTQPLDGGDSDGDGFTDAQETFMSQCIPGGLLTCSAHVLTPNVYSAAGTAPALDATKSCAQTTVADDEQPLDNWPLDFNDDRADNLTDVFLVVPGLNLSIDQPPSSGPIPTVRMDISDDGAVNLTDVFLVVPKLNLDCAGAGVPAWSQQ